MPRDQRETEAAGRCEQRLFAIRNRALLYLRGMGIGAVQGMELAAESIRRAGDNPQMEQVFTELFALLRGRDVHSPGLGASDSLPVHPALNRRPMLAGELPHCACLEALGKMFAPLFALLLLPRNLLWRKR